MDLLALLAHGSAEFCEEAMLGQISLKPAARFLPNIHVRMQVRRRFPFENSGRPGAVRLIGEQKIVRSGGSQLP
jgi:hypothetical protein